MYREGYWIDNYISLGLAFNIIDGKGSQKLSEEARDKIKLSNAKTQGKKKGDM